MDKSLTSQLEKSRQTSGMLFITLVLAVALMMVALYRYQQVNREVRIYRALLRAQAQGSVTPEQIVQTMQTLQEAGSLSR